MERPFSALILIGFVTWLLFTWSGYAKRHSENMEGWSVGGTRIVEVTVVPEDRERLACASDVRVGNLHCGYTNAQQPNGAGDERDTLQPLNTIKNELLLGAGLFVDIANQIPRPGQRFTVVCNYHVEGVVKSATLRWETGGQFVPASQSVTLGHLTDCVLPK